MLEFNVYHQKKNVPYLLLCITLVIPLCVYFVWYVFSVSTVAEIEVLQPSNQEEVPHKMTNNNHHELILQILLFFYNRFEYIQEIRFEHERWHLRLEYSMLDITNFLKTFPMPLMAIRHSFNAHGTGATMDFDCPSCAASFSPQGTMVTTSEVMTQLEMINHKASFHPQSLTVKKTDDAVLLNLAADTKTYVSIIEELFNMPYLSQLVCLKFIKKNDQVFWQLKMKFGGKLEEMPVHKENLDQLKYWQYIGYLEKSKRNFAILQNERAETFFVAPGSYVNQNWRVISLSATEIILTKNSKRITISRS